MAKAAVLSTCPTLLQLVGQLWGRLSRDEKQGWVQRAARARSARGSNINSSGQVQKLPLPPLLSCQFNPHKGRQVNLAIQELCWPSVRIHGTICMLAISNR